MNTYLIKDNNGTVVNRIRCKTQADADLLASAQGFIAELEVIVKKPTANDVNNERNRRIMVGKSFIPVGYSSPIPILGDDQTRENLFGLGFAASLTIGTGDTTTITQYRDADNVMHDLTPPQMLDLWKQGAEWIKAVYTASFAIKDDPAGIPDDYANDPRWPV